MNEILLGMKIRFGFAITEAIMSAFFFALGIVLYGVWYLFLMFKHRKR